MLKCFALKTFRTRIVFRCYPTLRGSIVENPALQSTVYSWKCILTQRDIFTTIIYKYKYVICAKCVQHMFVNRSIQGCK